MPSAMIQGAPAYYWERDYDRITQALMGLNQMLDEKEKEKERRKARDMALLQDDPRQAAGPMGKQFIEQYADDPQAVEWVKGLARQGESQMNLEAGQSNYFMGLYESQKEAGRRAAEFLGVGQDLQDAADTLNMADAWAGAPQDPNLTPQSMVADEIQSRINYAQNQEDPRWTAFSQLPYEQAAEMGPWLAGKGQFPMPKILGVGMDALDPKVVLASQMNLPVDEQYKTFMRSIGAMPSIGQEAQLAYNEQSLAARQQMAENALASREQLAEAAHRARLAEIDARAAAKSGGSGAPTVQSAVAAVVGEYRNQQKADLTAARAIPTTDTKGRKEALASVAQVPPTSVATMFSKAATAAGLEPEIAALKFQELWEKSLAAAGNDPTKAAGILSAYLQSKGLK